MSAGLWLVGEVVNHVGLYGSKVAEGYSAFQHWSYIIFQRNCLNKSNDSNKKNWLKLFMISLPSWSMTSLLNIFDFLLWNGSIRGFCLDRIIRVASFCLNSIRIAILLFYATQILDWGEYSENFQAVLKQSLAVLMAKSWRPLEETLPTPHIQSTSCMQQAIDLESWTLEEVNGWNYMLMGCS